MRVIEDPAYGDIETLYGGMEKVIGINENPYCKPIIRETGNHMTTFDKITHNLTGLRSTIRQVLLESFDADSGFPHDIEDMYDSVWEVMKNNGTDEFRVFTTNYDTVMDSYAHGKGFEIVNGFAEGGHLRSVWADAWGRRTANTPLYLTKLHGSVRWHKDADGEIVETGGVTQRDFGRDVLIAPTEGAKDYGGKPFPALMDRFRREIGKVDVLLVIGFSYRDDEMVRIIRDRLGNGMSLISVSPDAATDIRRVQDAEPKTVGDGSLGLKTVEPGIVLCEQEFAYDTIHDMCKSLDAAYELIQESGPIPRPKIMGAAP